MSLMNVEDAQLVVRLGPQFGQHGGVQVRAVGDHDPGIQAPGLEVLEEPPHVVLVVGGDQGEGHRQVAQRVGGQQQSEATQVEFVHAERPAEVLQDHAAMRGHVELLGMVAEHVVDEPRGQVEEELALERSQGPFDAHAVLEDPLQDQVADAVVVLGLGVGCPVCAVFLCKNSCQNRSRQGGYFRWGCSDE